MADWQRERAERIAHDDRLRGRALVMITAPPSVAPWSLP
jgi:hypothetical protein